MDNRYIDGSSTPISEWDAEGNSYQRRRLSDGTENRVLKNFPAEDELRRFIAPYAASFDYRALDYYWLVEYEARPRVQ
jgi:demethylmenaquinone methyltransferase/2-methoxy-6-polyprenyl-1,4-benzoquinol methylase